MTPAQQTSDPALVLEEARRELARLPGLLEALVGDLDGAAVRTRPAPDEWAPVEILCHLRDEETEDFASRLRVVLARGTAFAPIDPERWAEERRYRHQDPRLVLTSLRELRSESLALLASVAPADLTSAVAHASIGALSGLDLLVAWVAHDRLHLHQLAGTLARLWTTRWAPLKVEYAGPIPYPPTTPC
ncbi:MAG TPA: DinB family protein [Candidatus Methylomirabilis sp.]|nr:DinB family protein [Candidatus Methylomirabilis sp.]